MRNPKSSVTVGGTSFCNLLFLTFLVLKLTNVINWSWWWVTAPLWIPVGLALGAIVVLLVVAIISIGLAPRKDRWS